MNVKENCICSNELKRNPFSDNFDALDCNNCGSRRFEATSVVKGTPTLEFQYGGDNKKYTEKDYLYGKQLRWAHLELLKQNWSGRKVLEIGCFNGFFLSELQNLGADVYGFDVNQEAVKIGSDLFGLKTRLDISLKHLARHGPYDDILCIDVLEHLDQPGTLLTELYALLRAGGRIIVAGPTVERCFHDQSDFPPHHKWWFSRPGLQSMLRRHNFKIISIVVQRDGMLFLRNLIGRALSGIHKKEFYGQTSVRFTSIESVSGRLLYKIASLVGTTLFTLLRLSYCSAIFIAKKEPNP